MVMKGWLYISQCFKTGASQLDAVILRTPLFGKNIIPLQAMQSAYFKFSRQSFKPICTSLSITYKTRINKLHSIFQSLAFQCISNEKRLSNSVVLQVFFVCFSRHFFFYAPFFPRLFFFSHFPLFLYFSFLYNWIGSFTSPTQYLSNHKKIKPQTVVPFARGDSHFPLGRF